MRTFSRITVPANIFDARIVQNEKLDLASYDDLNHPLQQAIKAK
ncbi:MAG: hypothetical protein ACLSA2_01495 [Candidatus Gastranaerophilaceae bacterium]